MKMTYLYNWLILEVILKNTKCQKFIDIISTLQFTIIVSLNCGYKIQKMISYDQNTIKH